MSVCPSDRPPPVPSVLSVALSTSIGPVDFVIFVGSLRLAESEVRRTEADLRLTLIYTDVMETTSLVNGTKEIKVNKISLYFLNFVFLNYLHFPFCSSSLFRGVAYLISHPSPPLAH